MAKQHDADLALALKLQAEEDELLAKEHHDEVVAESHGHLFCIYS